MGRPLDVQIRYHIERYIRGSISLGEFLDWFVPRSWDIEQSGNSSAIDLAHRVDGILGESSSADWSENELRGELANAIGPFVQMSAQNILESRLRAFPFNFSSPAASLVDVGQ